MNKVANVWITFLVVAHESILKNLTNKNWTPVFTLSFDPNLFDQNNPWTKVYNMSETYIAVVMATSFILVIEIVLRTQNFVLDQRS